MLEHDISAHKSLAQKYYIPDAPKNSLSIFTAIPITELIEKMIGKHNNKTFTQPLLRADSLIKDLQHIERLTGKSELTAQTVANALLKELELTTTFPKDANNVISFSKEQLLTDINRLLMHLGSAPYTPPIQNKIPENSSILPELPDLPKLPNFSDLSELENLEQHINNLDLGDFGLENLPIFQNPDQLKILEELLNDKLIHDNDDPDK